MGIVHDPILTGEAHGSRKRDWSINWLAARLSGLRSQLAVVHTVAAQLAIFGIMTVQSIVLARLLGPEGRGEYATAIVYSQTLLYVGLLGTLFSIARRAGRDVESRPELANAALRTGLTTGTMTMAVAMVLGAVALPAEKKYLAPLAFGCAALLPWEQMRLTLLAVDHGSAAFSRYNANRLLSTAVFPLGLLVLWSLGLHAVTLVVVLAVATPMIGLAFLLHSHKEVRPFRPSAPPVKCLIKEGLPYAYAVLAGDLLGRLDILLVLWLLSFTVQGCYAVAVPAASLLLVVPNGLALFAFNAGARDGGSRSIRKLVLAGTGVFGLQAFSACILALILRPLILCVFGESFHGAVPLALALLPKFGIDGFALVAEGYLRGRGKPIVGVWSRILGAIVVAAFVLLFFERWQALSIPLAASAGQAVSASVIVWAVIAEIRRNATIRLEE